jgi:hypothetical protein
MNARFVAWIYFVALMLTAIALGPALAHLLELPNKIVLPRNQYFIVQNIYRGWALLGIVVVSALGATLALPFAVRHHRVALRWAILAFLCMVGTQAIFWTWTYPANVATVNWTEVPDNWQALRDQWEFAHAFAAMINLVAMGALVLSLLAWRRNDQPSHA